MKHNPCNAEECNNPRFSKGYCKFHQHLRTDEKYKRSQEISRGNVNKKPKTASKIVRISPVSDKQLEKLRLYRGVRDEYMKIHSTCECRDCNRAATEVHHMGGRIGDNLINANLFLAVCRMCHRYIEEHPAWAKEEGYSVDRLGNDPR